MGRGALIRVEALHKHFSRQTSLFGLGVVRHATAVRAVDGVSFEVFPGEALGLVGESGSGKTTTGKLLVRLQEPTAGSILFEGADIAHLRGRDLMGFRRGTQMVFQDPYESLNPRFTVFRLVEEPLVIHGLGARGERRQRALEIIELAGLRPARKFADRFPHELSGGQRQRVAVARALAMGPKFVVADEPTSMLDVSIKAGILRLFLEWLERRELAILYISHDLSLVRYLCRRTAIMFRGRIVEMGETEEILRRPLHPYTRDLLAAIPSPDPDGQPPERRPAGAVAAVEPIGARGCSYRFRCCEAMPVCGEIDPALRGTDGGRTVACHLYGE